MLAEVQKGNAVMKSGALQSQATVKMAYRKIYEEEKKKPGFYGKLKVKKGLNIKKKKRCKNHTESC